MRILFVNERAGFFGGVEQHVHDSARALAALGHITGLLFAQSGRDEESMAAPFAYRRQCPDLFHPESAGHCAADIQTEFAPDVIYVHRAAAIQPFLDFSDSVRIVRMIHDHDLCCPRRHKYYAIGKRICARPAGWRCVADLAFLARGASPFPGIRFVNLPAHARERRRHRALDALLVGSRFMQEELVMNGIPPEKVHIVPPTLTSPQTDAEPLQAPDAPNLLYVGQLVCGKGVDLLLRAVARVRAPVVLKIAGTGNEEAPLKNLCRQLQLQDRVEFLGWTAPARLLESYRWSRVVAVPSRWPEPFGMVGIEAMRARRAVVGFASGGIPDWLRDGVNGRLAPTGDVEALSAAIEEMLENIDLCRCMGAAGWEIARSEFDPGATAARLETLLQSPRPD